MRKTLAVLISDGVSLRNFVYSNFTLEAQKLGWDLVFINQTSFDFETLNLKHKTLKGKPSAKTNLLKRARKDIELKNFERQFNDKTYRSYRFPQNSKSIKQRVKNSIVNFYKLKYSGRKLSKLRSILIETERNSSLFRNSITLLTELKPDALLATSQRSIHAIAPILAARELHIPTASFIYSWDNVPKATLVVEPDCYFVWSDYMKAELLKYYPYIEENQVFITGTPQFEMHADESLIQTKEEFYRANNLDKDKDYICFSGDDITTSPHDEHYLEDVAKAITKLNAEGNNLGLIFRRCPVDFSKRYDSILKEYEDIIVPLAPIWNANGTMWNTIIPQVEDQSLLLNTVKHSKLIINLGSSMVFDAVCHETPCAYVNYNPEVEVLKKDIYSIYKYIHFRSMPSLEAVIWLNSAEEISVKIKGALSNENSLVETKKWFERINQHPITQSSSRILNSLKSIV